jgi:predicted anti-sigma-YlaC factor YlaD
VDCNEVLDQLSDYLDQEARAELCREIEAHMLQCRNCRLEVDTLKKTIVLYQSGEKIEMPVRIKSRLSEALAREYASTPQKEPASFD